MVELGALPLRGRVADNAIPREARRHVVRIGRAVVVREVTTVAGGRRAGVLTANVARSALAVAVRPGEGEPGLCMVELGSLPLQSRVTDRAVLGEASRGVIGIRGAVVVRQVAPIARGCCPPEHIVLVALGALRRRVRSGQGELRPSCVVELDAFPLGRRVALRTVFRELSIDMIRRRGLGEGIHVAAVTALRRTLEGAAGMALSALRTDVGARERELRLARVVELRPLPLGGRMANGAVFRETRDGVVWAARLLECRNVTAFAGLRGPRESAVDVAGGAIGLNVGAGETEPAQIVVELSPFPLRRGVTLCAVPREVRRRVRRIGGLVECVEVAPFTSLRGSSKAARNVTRVALDLCVRTCQRELGTRRVIERRTFPLCAGVAN